MQTTKTRSLEAIIFDLVLLSFVSTLVGVAVSNLGSGARLVPLIIGVPTLAGLLVQLLFDLFPALRAKLSWKRPARTTSPLAEEETEGRKEVDVQDVHFDDVLLGKEAEDIEETPEQVKRELIFSGWVVGFFVLTAIFGLLISIPAGLLFFFKVLNREGWVLSLALTVGTWFFIYGLFGMVLGVSF